MKQRVTVSLSGQSVKFVKKYAKENNSTVSELIDRYFDMLRRMEEANKKIKKKDVFTEKFSGIFNTGSKDIMKELFGK